MYFMFWNRYIYIYIEKKNLTKKLESFYNTHYFCKFSTHSIVIIKYNVVAIICDDVVAIICDGSAIQCDASTL